MIWGDISVRYKHLDMILSCDQEKVVSAIKYAHNKIKRGDLIGLFNDFEKGNRKLPGIGHAYFTKLFFFLGEIAEDIKLKPLIFDKWMANAHFALLIQLGQNEERRIFPYKCTKKDYELSIPTGKAKVSLYIQYVQDMSQWANKLKVTPAKLEEFLFGLPLDSGEPNNPRIQLWEIISNYCGRYKR